MAKQLSKTGTDQKQTPVTSGETESPLIVGVGASAGGLSAFRTLLQHLPADTGMVFARARGARGSGFHNFTPNSWIGSRHGAW